MNYQLLGTPSEELENKVLAGLRAFNRSQSPLFYTKLEAKDSAKPLNLFAFDDDGALAGGLLGTSQLSWLKTEILFVEEAHRKYGVGRELMQRAENEARSRGCTQAYVDTMQWQARGFYEKLGYRVAGELPDWDSHGHAKYFLIKKL
jgi:GNAT superfamily N-acetyltransferase